MTKSLRSNGTTQPAGYRSCRLCTYAVGTHCKAPEVVDHMGGRVIPFADARATTGPCGPEARYLDFPGLRP